jgi:hypothetical protein
LPAAARFAVPRPAPRDADPDPEAARDGSYSSSSASASAASASIEVEGDEAAEDDSGAEAGGSFRFLDWDWGTVDEGGGMLLGRPALVPAVTPSKRGREGPASVFGESPGDADADADALGGLVTLSEARCRAVEPGEEKDGESVWGPAMRLRMGKEGWVGSEGETEVAMTVVREEGRDGGLVVQVDYSRWVGCERCCELVA